MPQPTFVRRLRRLVKSFEPPFLPLGFVKLTSFRYKGRTSYSLEIGDREVSFDADGKWNGQGTDLPGEWIVRGRRRRRKR